MFYLLFKVGDRQYALETGQVREVLPVLNLRTVAKAPEYVAGTFTYGNRIVPVVDLSVLMGLPPSRPFYSSRLILVTVDLDSDRKAILALLAEGVVDLVQRDRPDTVSWTMNIPDAPYLGDFLPENGENIQFIQVEELVDEKVRELLRENVEPAVEA
jgi:chemotaxis-related protein WspB